MPRREMGVIQRRKQNGRKAEGTGNAEDLRRI